MALSNIFREPRREITESVTGVAAFLLITAVAIPVTCKLSHIMRDSDGAAGSTTMPYVVYMLVAIIIEAISIAAFVGLLFLTHAWGESICNFLANRGLELRPKQRR
jgi:hypothetical protein